ncbi:membrane protein insertion efficiency factor YidD [Cellulomonas fimi]|uniref:membrane protein insertion efficiency factor YidD n=1 Tax=Cellulomonas fimi TaxID=1708 RepID=UPI0023582C08|nr:membrane protein insertion efficiency factor YidD [Cellulomonas fimi]
MTWRSVVRGAVRLPAQLVLLLLRGYQRFISPMTPPTCRFYPSCSQYAVIAVTRHGLLRGSWLAVRRLLRCHPWNPGGVDDVPPARPPHHHHRLHRHPDVAPSTH